MKNYIITRGENSDYHICNVTTNYKNTRSDRKKMSKETLGYLTAITLVIIAVIALIAGTVNNFSNDHKYTVTITDKERVTIQSAKGSTGSRYLIVKTKTARLMSLKIQILYLEENSIHLMFTVL